MSLANPLNSYPLWSLPSRLASPSNTLKRHTRALQRTLPCVNLRLQPAYHACSPPPSIAPRSISSGPLPFPSQRPTDPSSLGQLKRPHPLAQGHLNAGPSTQPTTINGPHLVCSARLVRAQFRLPTRPPAAFAIAPSHALTFVSFQKLSSLKSIEVLGEQERDCGEGERDGGMVRPQAVPS